MRLDEGRDAAHGDDSVGHHSPITVDSPSPPPQTTSSHRESHSPSSHTHPSSLSPSNEPASPSSAQPASAGAKPSLPPTSTKPRSSASGHKPRSPSPSPPPPPVKPPPQTIRLDIQLGGPEDYEVDINRLSKETGQRPPTPPIIITGVSRDESDESEPDEPQNDLKPKKRRKRVSDRLRFASTLLILAGRRRTPHKSTMTPATPSLMTQSSPSMSVPSLRRQNNKAFTCRVVRSRSSPTSEYTRTLTQPLLA